jgi:hypothetical protein
VERARYAADYVLGRSELAQVRRPEECASALRAIAEVCVEARYTPSKTSDACLEAMEKAMACGVPADKVANAARRFLGQALRPQAVKPEFVPAAPRTSILSSFRSMFSSSPSARAANPNSIYSVAVDGRPFYSSHLRDQAMRRFMQKRSSGRGEVTLSIDGDVAYRAASGGAVRVGNPLSGRTPNHHRTGILSEDYPIDPYNKDLDKAYDPYDRYWRAGNPVGNSGRAPNPGRCSVTNTYLIVSPKDRGDRRRFVCGNGLSFSLRAGKYLFSKPQSETGPWESVEVAYTSRPVPELFPYEQRPPQRNSRESVYQYVPVEVVDDIIEKNGGISPTDSPGSWG